MSMNGIQHMLLLSKKNMAYPKLNKNLCAEKMTPNSMLATQMVCPVFPSNLRLWVFGTFSIDDNFGGP